MTDLVRLLLQAGRGGHGKVSFFRHHGKAKGGPDGGDGGNGGNVVLIGDKGMATLKAFAGATEFVAESGGNGGKQGKTGAKGEDIVLRVPLGTVVRIFAENVPARNRRLRYGFEALAKRGDVHNATFTISKEVQPLVQEAELNPPPELVAPNSGERIARSTTDLLKNQSKNDIEQVEAVTLTEHAQRVIICQGGFGGRGNEAFKSSRLTTPLKAEYGTWGEVRAIELELKLLADVGLVGLPNAGKSTLLSVLTEAKPKIAAYPFTTLEPHLGLLKTPSRNIVIADIPGLIAGASEGKGLGHDFLRHIENCQALLFILFLDESVVYDKQLSDKDKAEQVWQQFESLRQELTEHSPEIIKKTIRVGVNKVDLYSPDLQQAISRKFSQVDISPVFFSASRQQHIPELIDQLNQLL